MDEFIFVGHSEYKLQVTKNRAFRRWYGPQKDEGGGRFRALGVRNGALVTWAVRTMKPAGLTLLVTWLR
jgi:hypothetical protein